MTTSWTGQSGYSRRRPAHATSPSRQRGSGFGYTYDLRQDLDNRAGQTRSIYGSRGRAPTTDDDHQAWRDRHNQTRAENRTRCHPNFVVTLPDTEAPHTP